MHRNQDEEEMGRTLQKKKISQEDEREKEKGLAEVKCFLDLTTWHNDFI